jgi:hypothetical protein
MGISYFSIVKLIDRAFLAAGVMFLFLGFAGLILVLISRPEGMFRDPVNSLGIAAINLFMTLLGIALILFHGKIIVKPTV